MRRAIDREIGEENAANVTDTLRTFPIESALLPLRHEMLVESSGEGAIVAIPPTEDWARLAKPARVGGIKTSPLFAARTPMSKYTGRAGMVTRRDIEGTLARWFAVDADSRIAVFTGPYAAWPATVFDDYPTVDSASEFMAAAPATTEAVLSARSIASGGSPFPTRGHEAQIGGAHEASRGLYSFDADPGYGGQTVYFLDASPVHPLLEPEAPRILQRAARLVRFPSIRFATVTQIDLAGLVPLVVGNS
jgi:hypothetical protein